ncbi:MAG: chemotaxis protein CheX [Pirellulaceae bacterium]|nr:chemotaxis protein CheX [Pirellulaceae bacterium]
MTATGLDTIESISDPILTQAVIGSVGNAFSMCNISAKLAGVATVPTGEPGLITGMIGVHGKVSGFVTVNIPERMAIRSVEGLLQDNYGQLTSQVVDGVGEITNIIVGGIKSALAGSSWGFSHITVPSVIVGQKYNIAFSRGVDFLCVTFEHSDDEAVLLEDRLMNVCISLLRL